MYTKAGGPCFHAHDATCGHDDEAGSDGSHVPCLQRYTALRLGLFSRFHPVWRTDRGAVDRSFANGKAARLHVGGYLLRVGYRLVVAGRLCHSPEERA